MHGLDLGLYSHPTEFWGDGVRTHVNSKGKILSTRKFSSEEDRTHGAASSKTAIPTHYQRAIPAPILKFERESTSVCVLRHTGVRRRKVSDYLALDSRMPSASKMGRNSSVGSVLGSLS